MPRRRWLIALAILIPLLAAVEVVVRRWERPKAGLQVINEGAGPMEDLVIAYDGSRIPIGTLPRGQSANVRVTVGPLGPLRLEFRQKSNALQGLELADYDPARNLDDGQKQVVVVQTNQIQRYTDEDEMKGWRRSLIDSIREWFESALRPFQ